MFSEDAEELLHDSVIELFDLSDYFFNFQVQILTWSTSTTGLRWIT